jgi:O-antigen/teichoic acid export membrane protein
MAALGTAVESGSALLRPLADPAGDAAPRQLLGRASVAGAGSIYFQCVQFASGLVIARALGAADYGVFNLARNLVDTTSILTRMGLEVGLQRHFGETRMATDQAHRLVVLRQLRLVASLLALLPVIALALGLGKVLEANVYHHEGFAQILLCLALALPFITDVAVLGGAYRGTLRPGPAIFAEMVLMPTARLVLIVVLLLAGWDLWAVAAGTTIGAVLTSAWQVVRARRDFPASAATGKSWSEARRVISYSSVLAVAVLVTTLTSIMDILMLGRYVPAEQLGQYSLAKTLLLPIGFFAAAFNQGLGALIADRYTRGDAGGMLEVMSLVLRWIALGTLPVFAVFLFWGAQITLLFGPSFAMSASVIAWLAAGQFMLALLGSMGWSLSMTNRHYQELGILVAGLVLAGVLCMIVVPRHGQLGAAIATFVAIAFVSVIRLLWACRVMRGIPFDAKLLAMMFAGIAIAALVRVLVAQWGLATFWDAATGIGAFLLIYAAVCWWYLRTIREKAKPDALLRSPRQP